MKYTQSLAIVFCLIGATQAKIGQEQKQLVEDVEQKIIKISFRSKGNFSVNKFARNYFDGGGHDNASGGKSVKSLDETVAYFESLLPTYKNELEHSYEA